MRRPLCMSFIHYSTRQAFSGRSFMLGTLRAGCTFGNTPKNTPGELDGVALLEASSPQQIDELPGWRKSWGRRRPRSKPHIVERQAEAMVGLGSCAWELPDYKRARQDMPYIGQYQALQCRPGYVDADDSELPDFDTSAREAAGLREFGRIPLLIVSRDPSKVSTGAPDRIANEQVWQQEQEYAKHLSPLSWRIVAKGSGHMVPLGPARSCHQPAHCTGERCEG